MKKIFDNLKEMTNEEIKRGLNNFADRNCVDVALSKESREYLASRGIYGPYKPLPNEI